MKVRMFAFIAVLIAVLLGEKMEVGATEVPNNMVLIPASEFVMGNAFNRYNPLVRTVYVSAFFMDKYEVTKSLWDEVYQWATNHGYSFDNKGVGKAVNHSVYGINWYDMVKWCNARSEKDGYEPAYYTDVAQTIPYRTGDTDIKNDWVKWDAGYRLPTEAEWEKAARGGLSGKRFPWGDTISHSQANYFSAVAYSYDISPTRGFHPKFVDNSYPFTSPVGYFASNGYGLYDVQGNVWEWCWNWYVEISFDISPQNNPQGPAAGKGRVLRGGSFSSDVANGVGFRNGDGPLSMVYSQVGFRTVLSTKVSTPLTPTLDPIQVIAAQPVQPTYGICPVKELEKKNIVVVTHGWQPTWKPVDIEWVDTMTNAISQYLVNQGLTEWQVHAYRWTKKAHTGLPGTALDRGKEEGVSFGKYILSQGFDRVHVIAHSAGAGFAQAVSETIKAERPDIVVHLTFLDPFIGLDYAERDNYGKGADWAENYYSQDFETSGGILLFTEAALKYGYNVNVTSLDKNRRKIEVHSSTSSGDTSQACYEIVSSHRWPCEFYINTIPPNTLFGSEDLGFLASKEGGGWDSAVSRYKVGRNALRVLGSSEPTCIPNPSANSLHIELPQDFSKLPNASVIMNSPEHVIIHGIDFELRTASPAWLVTSIPITNRVNFVSLEAKFTSASGAEGLLSVYWETNVVGSVDERVTPLGTNRYKFPIPETAVSGSRTLGFRLDAFSTIQSSVTVTNVALGFAGVREPFSLSFVSTNTNGLPLLQLNGPSGWNYRVETSTNLVDWTTTVILANTNGVVPFIIPESTNAPARFYRAVAP